MERISGLCSSFVLLYRGFPGIYLSDEGELVVLKFEICCKGAIFPAASVLVVLVGSGNGEDFWALICFVLLFGGSPGIYLKNEGELVALMFEICCKGATFCGGYVLTRLVCERI